MQFALLGAGHLIGLTVGLAQLFGLMLAWGIAVPILTSPDTIAWLTAHGIPSIATTLPAGVGAEELASHGLAQARSASWAPASSASPPSGP